VWEKAPAFDRAKGSAYTWLATLTRNRAIDRLRSKNFRHDKQKLPDFDFETMADDSTHTPLDNTSLAERAGIVKTAFVKLPIEQREVLELAYFQGYSQSEIAAELRLPLGTVKTRTREGMKKLNRILRELL
jgi:RNA polymerase sigma-70 factor (ECF subfamily)